MARFQIGDRVEVLDELIKGAITAIEGNELIVDTDDGFTMRFPSAQLVKVGDDIAVTNYEAHQIKKVKESFRKRTQKTFKPKQQNTPKMEVDLHIHQLVKNTKGMTNFDMLNVQLDTAKRQLEFAIRKRIPKIVFIHGVGEGVLKEELRYLFKKYAVEHYDADYQKYGLGATEVRIFQTK